MKMMKKFFTFKDFYGTGPSLGFIVEGRINNEDHFVSLDGNLIQPMKLIVFYQIFQY
jgi:hypothetical protein